MSITEDLLVSKLRYVVPEHVERALVEARQHAETTLTGTQAGYLRWCLDRAANQAPMPWDDPDWELREKMTRVVHDASEALLLFGRAMQTAAFCIRDVFAGFAAAARKASGETGRLRRQSWQRRRHGRSIK